MISARKIYSVYETMTVYMSQMNILILQPVWVRSEKRIKCVWKAVNKGVKTLLLREMLDT